MSRHVAPSESNRPTHTVEDYLMTMLVMERDYGEIVAARLAEMMAVAPATVAMTLKRMERDNWITGTGRKAVHLTETGRELQTACHEIFQVLARTDDRLSSIRGLESGRLQLAISTTGKYFAPRMLAAFLEQHPGVDVSLQIHNRRTLLERLADDMDDLYIFAERPGDVEVVMQQILPNPMVVFARSDHMLAGQKGIPFERIAQERFLMREPGSGTRIAVQEIFDRHGLQPWVRMELSTNEAITEAILSGLGISIMPRHTLGHDAGNDQLITLDVEGFPLERYWYFVYPIGKQLPVAAQAFMEFTRENVQQLVLGYLEPHGVARKAVAS